MSEREKMTEREKLMDMIITAENEIYRQTQYVDGMKRIEKVVDNLLANGVTILPCKAGDILYSIWQDDDGNLQIDETEIVDVSIHKIWVNGGGFDVDCLGKSDFLSREEAEKEIAERCK